MILRLFSMLLLMCLALPALAMPLLHGPAYGLHPEQAHHGHHDPQPGVPDAPMAHGCIGCIPPDSSLSRHASPYRFGLTLRYPVENKAMPSIPDSAPDTPPPKYPA